MDMRMGYAIEAIALLCYKNAKSKGFHDVDADNPPRTFGDEMILAVGELSEAYEEFRDHRDLNEVYFREDGKPEGIPVEIADAIIRLAETAWSRNMPLGDALAYKMAYNRTRPHRHGKKL
jgi:hypothetical protein